MSLGEHFIEFRNRLLISAIAIAISLVAGWMLSYWVWDVLREPIQSIEATGRTATIMYTDISSAFDIRVQTSLFIAVLISSPVWLYQIWAFIVPGLTRKEKWYAVGFLAAAVPLFLAGIYAGWSVLPNIVKVMSFFQDEQEAFNMDARAYLDFTVKLLLAIGIGFVMPVLLVLLNFVGVIRGKTILKSWRIAMLLIVLFAAITTPAADLSSMFLLSVPIIVLYFIAAGIAVLHDRQRDKRKAKMFSEYDLEDAPSDTNAE